MIATQQCLYVMDIAQCLIPAGLCDWPEQGVCVVLVDRIGLKRPISQQYRDTFVVKQNLWPVPAARGLCRGAVGEVHGAVVGGGRRKGPRVTVKAVRVCTLPLRALLVVDKQVPPPGRSPYKRVFAMVCATVWVL